MTRRTYDVCAFEARLALMRAALRAVVAREQHDDEALALWRGHADVAREWLRSACEADGPGQLVLGAAA